MLHHRAYKICDYFSHIGEEFQEIRGFLLENGFPKAFIDKCIRSFLRNILKDQLKMFTLERVQADWWG